MWRDRTVAGRELAERLTAEGYAGRADVIILGIPRGGVEIAREVADQLGVALDIVVARKVGAPGAPEFAAGAVDTDGRVYANPEAGVDPAWLRSAAVSEHAEALRRLDRYRVGRAPLDLRGKAAIVVDDGIATGLTARAALQWVRGRGAATVVLAVPVVAPDTLRLLEDEADDVIALSAPAGFMSVGQFYESFPQLTDEDVVRLLAGR